ESPPDLDVDDEWRTPSIEKSLEELRSLKPIITRQELLDLMAANDELRAMGPAARQVIALTSREGSSIDEIARTIRQDQALSLKVLRLSNSTLYCRGERVDSVKKAVQRIGVTQIRGTVMAMGVVSQFATGGLAGRLKAERFWEHSITTGLIAQRLAAAQRVPAEEADQMFTAGLLHDIGRMLYAERLGDRYAKVIAEADRLGLPLETVESRLLLINHADMTDRLLRQWKFPPELINPIALHHLSVGNIRRMVPRAVKPVATLALANRLAHALLLGSSGNDVLYPIEEFVSALGVSEETVAQVMRETPEQAFDMKTFMLANSGDGVDAGCGALEEARARLGDGVRPLAVALRPAVFGSAYTLERLRPLGAAEMPTVAVVRVAAPAERARLIDLLRGRERDTGAGELPVLVLGSSPGCFFPKGHLGARAVEQIVSPVRLERVLDALVQLSARPAAAAAA
ncbi:MAG: HDOD domain-containing protein, partial [Phycisphaerales bacterium]|nr:HDOD domain-containing protein [Phycisphaerales bacterium]